MRSPEAQSAGKGSAVGAGLGAGSRKEVIPLVAAAMEAAFKQAGVAVHVDLRDPKVFTIFFSSFS